MWARWVVLLTVIFCCSACGAPSLRHKREVNQLMAAGQFQSAADKLEKVRTKEYSRRDSVLYDLDSAAILQEAHQYGESDRRLARAQDRIDELFTQSISAHAARYLINDLTVPYVPAPYERALTYYYRAMNFLSQEDIGGALVEANRAVYYLDDLRGTKKSGWRDDPFVQYFMSLVFESAGKRDDARIARARAAEGNAEAVRNLRTRVPDGEGEVVLVHANGVVPLKKSQTFQVAWGHILVLAQNNREGDRSISPQVQNAINAGLLGGSVTIAYPVLEKYTSQIVSSEVVTASGAVYPTYKLGDVAESVEQDLKEKEISTYLRMAARAAGKRIAAVQARHAATNASKDNTVGQLSEMFVSFLGAVTERADTRQWFTLPAEMRLARLSLPAGRQDITLRFRDGYGKIIGEYTFKDVLVKSGGRVYLHYRTAK